MIETTILIFKDFNGPRWFEYSSSGLLFADLAGSRLGNVGVVAWPFNAQVHVPAPVSILGAAVAFGYNLREGWTSN